MRENKKTSYIKIAQELNLTPSKAKHIYEWFYHEKVLVLINNLQEKVESQKEKDYIWEHYFRNYHTSKKRYDALIKAEKL